MRVQQRMGLWSLVSVSLGSCLVAACSAGSGEVLERGAVERGETSSGGAGADSGVTGGESGGQDAELELPPSLDGNLDGGGPDCAPALVAVVRDFDSSHADFETGALGAGTDSSKPFTGLVQDTLVNNAPSLSPAAQPGVQVTSATTFADWYSTSHPEERTHLFDLDSGLLDKSEDEQGNTVYESSAFFPIDDVASAEDGFRDGDGIVRNFHFTLELNTTFVYRGGETFAFRGDDDLWVFIDGALVVDLGGMHLPVEGSVELDSLGLVKGQEYPLSVFHAERHTSQSNFKLTTSLDFTNCEPILR